MAEKIAFIFAKGKVRKPLVWVKRYFVLIMKQLDSFLQKLMRHWVSL